MRYVLITGNGPEHRYVANRLDREIGLSAVIIDEGQVLTSIQRLKQLWKKYTILQLCGRSVLTVLKYIWRDKQKYKHDLRTILGPDVERLERPELEIKVWGINTLEGIERVRTLRPGRLLVYGSGIVSSKVLDISERPPLNMHTGISPHFRGASCAFWPLHEGELSQIGATIHEVTSKVDGGGIYSVRKTTIEPNDGIHAIFARCVVVGTDQYVEVLKTLENKEFMPEPQNLAIGREFGVADRGLFAELRVRLAIRQGLIQHWCIEKQSRQ